MKRFGHVLVACFVLFGLSCSGQRPLNPYDPDSPIHEPWEDEEAENLAWLISGEVYASKKLYDRIRTDLTLIRDHWGDSIPGLRVIRHVPWSYPPEIFFSLEPQIRDEMIRGEYHDWDSLNAFFGARMRLSSAVGPLISSSNRVNLWRMLQAYETLRGIHDVWPNTGAGDRPNIYAYLHSWGIAYLYRRAGGDCLAGCIWSQAHYFRSGTEGIEYVGYWDVDSEATGAPPWWQEARKCWDLYDSGDNEWQLRDTIPPQTVADLRLLGTQNGRSVSVSFTAPGDDGSVGRFPSSAYYEVCWLPEPVNNSNWDPQNLPPAQRPLVRFPTATAGETVILTLDRLRTDTINYIGLVTVDLAPWVDYKGVSNRSEISNLVISRSTGME